MRQELELLGEALASPLGIVVRLLSPHDIEPYKQKLYKARRTDPTFQSLSIVTPPDDPLALWIVKQGVRDGK